MLDYHQSHAEPLHAPSQPVVAPFAKRSRAGGLLRASALLISASWLLVFVVSVARRQEPAWPLRNISQYAAHYPSIYFFRAGLVTAAVFLVQAGAAVLPRVRWLPVLLWLMAVGAGGAAVVSCDEDNAVHSAFALALFLGAILLMARAAVSAWWAVSRNHRGPLFRAVPPASTPWRYAAGALLIVVGLAFAILIGGLGSGSFDPALRLPHEARNVAVSLIEWAVTADIVAFLVHFSFLLP